MKKIILLVLFMLLVSLPCYADELKTSDKPAVMGIVTIVDIAPAAKFDVKMVRPKGYTFDQFVDEFRLSDTIKQAITNQYMSRSLIIELNNNALIHYFKDEYTKDPQLPQEVFSSGAEKYSYDYIFVNVLKFNRIERITGSALFTLSVPKYWQVDAVSTYYLYDTKNSKLILKETIADKKESQFSSGSLFYSPPASTEDDALRTVLDKISQSMTNKILRKLPALQ